MNEMVEKAVEMGGEIVQEIPADDDVVSGEIVPADNETYLDAMGRAGNADPSKFASTARVHVEITGPVAAVQYNEHALEVLNRPLDPATAGIISDKEGTVYLPWQAAKAIIDEAFGPGKIDLVPIGPVNKFSEKEGQRGTSFNLFREFQAVINIDGAWRPLPWSIVAETSWTQADWQKVTPFEALYSSAWYRLLKRLGGAKELQDKSWIEDWKKRFAYRGRDGKWHKQPTPILSPAELNEYFKNKLAGAKPVGEMRKRVLEVFGKYGSVDPEKTLELIVKTLGADEEEVIKLLYGTFASVVLAEAKEKVLRSYIAYYNDILAAISGR